MDTRTAVAVKAVSPRQQHSFQGRPSQRPFRVNRSNSNSNSFSDPTYPRVYSGPRPPSNYGDSYVYSNPSPVAQLPDKEAMISGRSAIPLAPSRTIISGRSAMPFAPSRTMISGRNATASIISGHNAMPSAPPLAMSSGHNAMPSAPPPAMISGHFAMPSAPPLSMSSTVPVQAVINATPTTQPQDHLQNSSNSFTIESYKASPNFSVAHQPRMNPQQESRLTQGPEPVDHQHRQRNRQPLVWSHEQASNGEEFHSENWAATPSSSFQPFTQPQHVGPSRDVNWSSAIQESSPPGRGESGSPTVSPINDSFEHNNPHLKRPRPQDEEEGSGEEGGSTKRKRAKASNVNKRVTRSAAKKERSSAKGASRSSWVSRLPIVGSFFRSEVKEEDSDSEEYDTCEEDQSEDDQ